MKDIRTTLILLLSVGLVSTWVYHLYDKTIYSKRRTEVYIKDSAAVADGIRDSLQKIYSVAITGLDSQLTETKTNADSLKIQMNTKLGEIYKLKNEIGAILKNRGSTRADLNIARQKISELQQKTDELRTQNSDMEEEKNQLNAVLEQLTTDMKGLEQNIKRLGEENKVLMEKVNMASIFVASELKLSAVTLKNQKEQETNQAKKVTKLVASFAVQNNISEDKNADVYVVVTEPNGQILRNTVWESGSFDTRNEGKKNYTLKMHFEYEKGETKHLLSSLNADSYEPGNYTMQVYHNGVMIGKTIKMLE